MARQHIHAKAELKTKDKPTVVWEKRLTDVSSVFSLKEKLQDWLTKEFAFSDLTNKYHFDKDSSLEYMIINAVTLDEMLINVHVFSCFCSEHWVSKGKPPF